MVWLSHPALCTDWGNTLRLASPLGVRHYPKVREMVASGWEENHLLGNFPLVLDIHNSSCASPAVGSRGGNGGGDDDGSGGFCSCNGIPHVLTDPKGGRAVWGQEDDF